MGERRWGERPEVVGGGQVLADPFHIVGHLGVHSWHRDLTADVAPAHYAHLHPGLSWVAHQGAPGVTLWGGGTQYHLPARGPRDQRGGPGQGTTGGSSLGRGLQVGRARTRVVDGAMNRWEWSDEWVWPQ